MTVFFRLRIKHPVSGRQRLVGPKFISRESAESWRAKFYPLRSHKVLSFIEGADGKARELKLSYTATR